MDEAVRKKVLAESQKIQTLAHPFILPIREFYNDKGKYDGKNYDFHNIVNELATAGTLEEFIMERKEEGKSMSESELMRLFAMLVIALEETHAQG